MSTEFGNNQGGVQALASGTVGNMQQAGLPVGYNKLPLTQAAAKKQSAESLRDRRLAAAAGARSAASIQATLRVNGATVAASDVLRYSTGDLFIASTGGALAGAEPALAAVGTVQTTITDGAAKLQPLCERTAAPQSDTLSVTVTDNAGVSTLTQYNAYTNPELFEMGSTKAFQYVSQASTLSRWQAYTLFDGSALDNGLGANGLFGAYCTRVFVTQSDVIDIGYFAIDGNRLNERYRVWIDDKPVTEGALVPTGNGSARFLRLAIAGGRRKRRIRIAQNGAFIQSYVAIPSDCTLERPTDPGLVFLETLDSFGSTELLGVSSVHHDFAITSALALGAEHVAFAGIGGTSYRRANGARRSVGSLIRAGEFSSLSPDVVRYGHGYNAAGNGDSPELEADEALYCWQWVQDKLGDPVQIIRQPWYARPGFEAAMITQAARLRAAFERWGNPRSALISPLDGSILLGDGTVVREAGSPWLPSNSASWMIPPAGGDFDGAHISAAARPTFTDLDVDACDSALNALGV